MKFRKGERVIYVPSRGERDSAVIMCTVLYGFLDRDTGSICQRIRLAGFDHDFGSFSVKEGTLLEKLTYEI